MKNNIKKLIVVLLVTCSFNVSGQNKVTKNIYTTIDKIFNINLGMSPEEVSSTLAIQPYDIHQNLALNQLIVEYKYVHKFIKDKADEVYLETSRNNGELHFQDETSIYMVFDYNRFLISYFTKEGMTRAQDAYVWENTLMLLNSKVDCGSCIKLQKVNKQSATKVESKTVKSSKSRKSSKAKQAAKVKKANDNQLKNDLKAAKNEQAAKDKQLAKKNQAAKDKQAAKDNQADKAKKSSDQSYLQKMAKEQKDANDKEINDKQAAKDKKAKDKQAAKDKKAKDKQAAKDKKVKDKQAAKDKKVKEKQAAKDNKSKNK